MSGCNWQDDNVEKEILLVNVPCPNVFEITMLS